MNKVIYTAIFGDKDDLKSITKSKDYDYVVFTDNKHLSSDCFKVVVCPKVYDDPTRNARYYKVLSHQVLPNYEYSLWLDASIAMDTDDVDSLFNRYLKNHDIAVHSHPVRNCIYDEAKKCIEIGKDSPDIINQQMKKYQSEGYPDNNGLVSSAILFRKHSLKITKLNLMWWKEIEAHSRRDQLSFNYVVWKHAIDYLALSGDVTNNEVNGFSFSLHKKHKKHPYWKRLRKLVKL